MGLDENVTDPTRDGPDEDEVDYDSCNILVDEESSEVAYNDHYLYSESLGLLSDFAEVPATTTAEAA